VLSSIGVDANTIINIVICIVIILDVNRSLGLKVSDFFFNCKSCLQLS